MNRNRFGLILAIATSILTAAPAAAGDVASASLSSAGISFQPAVSYDTARMIVAGPDGYLSERTLKSGEALHLSAAALADGTYRYRLVLDRKVRPQAQGAATSALPPAVRGPVPKREVSGHFTVSGGRVLDPASRPAQ